LVALIPGRARRVRKLCEQAAEEADEIVAVSERLQDLFPNRRVTVVRNGVDDQLLQVPRSAPPGTRALVYVGTLSERFDASLTGRVLDRLPGWTLDLYGPCSYARKGDSPDAQLERLLAREDGRARWHGPVQRSALADVLDSADVLLLPSRGGLTRGQDSMKVYDCAARGRPIVATLAATEGIAQPPPHLYVASDADELAALVSDAQAEGHGMRGAPRSLGRRRVAGLEMARLVGGVVWHAAARARFPTPGRIGVAPHF